MTSNFEVYTPPQKTRKNRIPTFIAIDGEGEGDVYNLLGIGADQTEWETGLDSLDGVFQVLYAQYLEYPGAYFVGFYLSYDFNMWFKNVPVDRIDYLLTPEKVAKRRRKQAHAAPFPVQYGDWEFDILWGKRLKLRPIGATTGWMYICDTGPFFQTSLLNVLVKRPQPSLISDEMVATIMEGKDSRGTATLDEAMRNYNRLENSALQLLLEEMHEALLEIGLPLTKQEYHGPGQISQKWLKQQSGLERSNLSVYGLRPEIYDALAGSYYGGIFEITAHGHIRHGFHNRLLDDEGGSSAESSGATSNTTYEYDINSAYPDIIANLPCLCGEWISGGLDKEIPGTATLTLVHGYFHGTDQLLGPLPFRSKQRTVLRPLNLSGWYWQHEIEASLGANLLDPNFRVDKWIAYMGCEHPPPLADIRNLYRQRMRVGKETSMGKMLKHIYNSAYGKLAQSVGNPQVSNAVYAGLITAGCRAKIINAIASHPGGTEALVMIATDAVFFTSPHPTLKQGHELGEWECQERENLTIFKPGVYWDDKSRAAIAEGTSPVFKARGVRAKDFAKSLVAIDSQFGLWNLGVINWPEQEVRVGFTQISVKAAMNRVKGIRDDAERQAKFESIAGRVTIGREVNGVWEGAKILQSSNPDGKRDAGSLHQTSSGVWRTVAYSQGSTVETTPYDKRFGNPDDQEIDEWDGEDIDPGQAIADMLEL